MAIISALSSKEFKRDNVIYISLNKSLNISFLYIEKVKG